jgi:hypothetical protein
MFLLLSACRLSGGRLDEQIYELSDDVAKLDGMVYPSGNVGSMKVNCGLNLSRSI